VKKLASNFECAKIPQYVDQKNKARQFDLTSLFWFEPELWSGVSGGGVDRT
jgi:hypothetical protein